MDSLVQKAGRSARRTVSNSPRKACALPMPPPNRFFSAELNRYQNECRPQNPLTGLLATLSHPMG